MCEQCEKKHYISEGAYLLLIKNLHNLNINILNKYIIVLNASLAKKTV